MFRRLLLVAAVLAAMLAALAVKSPPPASAYYYDWQPFCPAGVPLHTGYTGIGPGGRCVGPLKPRIRQLFRGIRTGIEACIVGKANPDGSGGNVYPLTCSVEVFSWGPDLSSEGSNPAWPTIINTNPGGGLNVYGAWRGWFG